jgi:uncharacterized protein
MTEREKRTHSAALDVRKRGDGELPTLRGYAAVYGVETVIGGYFREQVLPNAFDEALARPDDVRAQFNHDSNFVLGRTTAGTLRLSSDEHGLAYEIDLPDTSYARDLAASVARGDISQSSFMFEVTGEAWEYPPASTGQLPLRKIAAVKLYDVAPVTFAAYSETSVSARALALRDAAPVEVPPAPEPPAAAPDPAIDIALESLALDEIELGPGH